MLCHSAAHRFFQGSLDFRSHMLLACRHVEILQKTFARFDTDNDGFITQEELSSMAKEKGFDSDASAVNSMMLEVDLNADGRIDFQEVRQPLARALTVATVLFMAAIHLKLHSPLESGSFPPADLSLAQGPPCCIINFLLSPCEPYPYI